MEENEVFYRVLLTRINPATAGADYAGLLLGVIREAFTNELQRSAWIKTVRSS